MSIMFAKKINKIINEKNNSELKKQREEKTQEEQKNRQQNDCADYLRFFGHGYKVTVKR